MKLKDLLKGLDAEIAPGLSKKNIESVSSDSRNAAPGALFVALEGLNFDGHKFVKDAISKGVAAVVMDKDKRTPPETKNYVKVSDTRKALSVIAKNFYGNPSQKLKVIGITGTNGKTTVAFLTERILETADIPCGVIGTIEYKTGKRRRPADRTTPDALALNALLKEMLENNLKAVAMEVSSHALDQKRVDDMLFDSAVFTNLSHEHLDYHKNIKNYLASKSKIFERLKKNGKAIINRDDEYLNSLKIPASKAITFGLSDKADVSAKIENISPEGSSFGVRFGSKALFRATTKLTGSHNIYNILAATSASLGLNIEPRLIKRGIESLDKVPGRLEPVETGRDFKVFVDYAHTHDALEKVLKFLNQIKKRGIITVFGCGGDRDRAKRPLMAQAAQRLSDFVFVTSDNPRSEDPEKITRDIEIGMDKKNGGYAVVLERHKAIEDAIKMARKDDIVLIAGKGHEKTQIIGERHIPFDDTEEVKKVLGK